MCHINLLEFINMLIFQFSLVLVIYSIFYQSFLPSFSLWLFATSKNITKTKYWFEFSKHQTAFQFRFEKNLSFFCFTWYYIRKHCVAHNPWRSSKFSTFILIVSREKMTQTNEKIQQLIINIFHRACVVYKYMRDRKR